MHDIVHGITVLAAIVVGVPVVGMTAIAFTALWRHFSIKSREMRLEEEKTRAENKAQQDELNAQILRMDDLGISPLEIASLVDEVRQLRAEVEQLKQISQTSRIE